jgi:hypothetical protein
VQQGPVQLLRDRETRRPAGLSYRSGHTPRPAARGLDDTAGPSLG